MGLFRTGPKTYPELKKTISPELLLGRVADVLLGKMIREANRKLVAGEDIDHVLNFIFNSLDLLIPYDRMAVLKLDSDKLTIRWMAGPGDGLGRSFPLEGSGLDKFFKGRKPRIIDDYVHYSAQYPHLELPKIALNNSLRSSLMCPLYIGNKVIGAILFGSETPNKYDESHVEVYLEISQQLAVIIALSA